MDAAATTRAGATLALGAVGVWGVWTASQWPSADGYYPMGVFALVAIFAILSATTDLLRARTKAATATGETGDGSGGPTRSRLIEVTGVVLLTFLYVAVWDTFGHMYPTAIYILLVLLVLRIRSPLVLILVPVGTTAFIQIVFGEVLRIPFP